LLCCLHTLIRRSAHFLFLIEYYGHFCAKNILIMKKKLLSLTFLFGSLFSNAQSFSAAIGGTTTTSVNQRDQFLPIAFANAKQQYLITNAELNAAGVPVGANIKGVQWFVNTDNSPGTTFFDVSANANVTFTDMTGGASFYTGTLTSLATGVSDAGIINGWHTANFSTPITVTSNNLLLQICRTGNNLTADDVISINATTYSSTVTGYNHTCASLTGYYTLSNKPTMRFIYSLPGAALNFDGGNDYVSIGSVIPLNSSYTKEAWVYANASGSNNIISSSSSPFWIMGGKLSAVNNGGAVFQDPAAFPLNQWVHVAVTYNSSTSLLSLFKNGILVNSGITNTGYPADDIGIGQYGTNGANFFQGAMDEIRIWNIVRTQCEINTYMNCEIPTTAAGLSANYHFNQGFNAANNSTVTTLVDASGNTNIGTLNNFALTGATSNWISPGAIANGYTIALAPPVVNSIVTNSVICNGNSTTLSGTGATTYTWTNGIINGTVFFPSTTTTYTVIGTVASTGCTNTAVSSVTVNATPTLSVNSGTICSGNSFTMVPSGASTYTYSSGSAIVSPTTNTSYSVTGTSALGCLSSNTAVSSVTVNALPTITVSSGAICAGNSYTINANGATSYTSVPALTGPIVTPTATTDYSITGTDANGCVSSNTAVSTVTVNALPTVSVTSGAICAGQSYTMIPSGATTYTYSSGSDVVTPTINASYNVTGTDANGCVSSNTAVSTVTVNAIPTVSVTSGAICAGQSYTMVPSGATTYTYSSGSDVVTPTINASYNVTGTDANGCVSSNTAVSTVTVNALPTVSVTSGSICSGKSFTMVPTGANTYTYSSGSSVVTPTMNASYNVTGTSAQGCVSSNTAVSTVTVNALPTVSVTSGSICSGKSFTMVPSGANTYTYSSGSAVVTPTATASFSVTGTSTQGCVSSNTVISTVTVNSLPMVMAATNSTLLCVGNSATLTASGATSYTWNTTATTTVIAVSPTTTVTYTVNGTGANGCSNTATVTQSVSTCAGIEVLSNDEAIKLYPNPNNGLFTIELTSLSKVTVTNALGQIVIAGTFEAGNHNLDIINQSNGVYFVKVIENNKQQIIKLIKE
jgi:hypothetical protein